eukprot:Blabericola_migrator_1__4654@NODE_2463_length_2722_cov_816_590960_g1541_i0_p3_GENE_NODE_2463_length_2722_cov_816_590960_g1541_i0NODE_2463_length_2722_cov_816_590960_g1541_i0_p3_ORF_typecomplete_len147_score31_18Acetyltransf_10/PF13673_7/5_4e18Acetyltransf_1/PF00583_25/1_5e12Acetyltransf_7/PF13508_7/2_4e12Acetyltransf_9/PF13527_7/6_6e11FR47/PF08445_10/6_7e08GNAT_acetyltran/PF12746_7/3e07Acetyltransf_5/PF13444_6/3_2e05Acetyltransf_5/PF13444_6/5_1e02Acetyltransf_4/PF13420_7/7_1e06Acetyltransf_CG/PF
MAVEEFQVTIATTQKDFFDIMRLRTEICVGEFTLPSGTQFDREDDVAIHYIVRDQHQELVASLRIVEEPDAIHVGKVFTKKTHRNKGIGSSLMNAIEQDAAVQEKRVLQLPARVAAQQFYSRLGFEQISDVFERAGMPHVMMQKCL